MDKDRQLAKEKVRELPLKGKIKHYWGYYKIQFIGALIALILIGTTVYLKVTEVKPDLVISFFAQDEITEEVDMNMEKVLSGLIEKEENEEEYIAHIYPTELPDLITQNIEMINAVYSKLEVEIQAGSSPAFIFDQVVYDYVMKDDVRADLFLKEYSGEMGENAKEALGLNLDKTYYYVTRVVYEKEKNDEEALLKHEYAKETYLKIKELN